MRKELKRAAAFGMSAVMAFGCMAGVVSAEDTTGKKVTIGVAFTTDSGPGYEATTAYLDYLAPTLNATFKYAALTSSDEAANFGKVQDLISSGVGAIIFSSDVGGSYIEECAAAGVYTAGYVSDFDNSYQNEYDRVFGNEYFLGTTAEGPCADENNSGQIYFDTLVEYNEQHPDDPVTHVAMAIFPEYAFPAHRESADQFVSLIEEYNETAEVPITVDPLDDAVDVLQFTTVDSTYFSKHEGIDGIVSFAQGSAFVYPTMVAAGVDSEIKLFTQGYNGGEEANFGTNGTGTFQQISGYPIESINYALVLLLNKLNGVEFADMPETAERISTNFVVVNSQEDLEKFEGYIAYTYNGEDSVNTAEEVLNMTAYANPDATYADLVAAVQNISIDTIE